MAILLSVAVLPVFGERSLFFLVMLLGYAEALLIGSLFAGFMPSDENGRYVALDGIRGFLAFGVFMFHGIMVIWSADGVWRLPTVNFEDQVGRESVALFFMITAFLFWGRVLDGKMEWKQFFVNRVFRIYPLYLFFIAIATVIAASKGGFALRPHFIADWLTFQYPKIPEFPDIVIIAGPIWSLFYEVCFYLAIPILAALFTNSSAKTKVWGAAVILIWLVSRIHAEGRFPLMFVGGMAAAYWVRDERLRRWSLSAAASFAAIFFLAVDFFFNYDSFGSKALVLLTAGFVIIASGNTLFGLLRTEGSIFLGKISYSMYLLHATILWFVAKVVFPRYFSLSAPSHVFLLILGVGPFVIAGSTLSFLWIEEPFIQLGKRLGRFVSVGGRRRELALKPGAASVSKEVS